MTRLLFYYTSNRRTVALETLAGEMRSRGFDVYFLTQAPAGPLHDALRREGIQVFGSGISSGGVRGILAHVIFLLKFVRRHRISILWSHLQPANIVAVLARPFMRIRLAVFRHHFHASIKSGGMTTVNRNERLLEAIICRLAPVIVVPSIEVRDGMVNYERANPEKIFVVRYVYDFGEYQEPSAERVREIRTSVSAEFLGIIASRMIAPKRHMLALRVCDRLIKKGIPLTLVLLDDGEERGRLEQFVADNGLAHRVFFAGFRTDLMDYFGAADLMIHPSQTEASSNVVKEFGILGKPVIACAGVGDFDEYISNGTNGYLLDEGAEEHQLEEYIQQLYLDSGLRQALGEALKRTIIDRFTPTAGVMEKYLAIATLERDDLRNKLK